ncbi:MAG: putative metal-binding motif-containing protein [Polyangiaceae bacterium]|nr:putative metal-binding motif-containing protein [Polyangiaceae bacterium]
MTRTRTHLSLLSLTAALAALTGCSANGSTVGQEPSGSGTGGSASGTGGASSSTGGAPGSGAAPGSGGFNAGGGAGTPSGSCTPSGPDHDGDGYTVEQGDCNDCDPNANPGAYDVAGNGLDEDCSGTPDDEPTACDQGLALEANDPMDAARALGLCRIANAGSWGVVSARWTGPDGSSPTGISPQKCSAEGGGNQVPASPPNPLSRGILPKFGNVIRPREGGSLVALSTGIAREGINHFSPMGELMCTTGNAPPGFPKDSPDCSVQTASVKTTIDSIALELVIKVPSNAHSFSFAFDFFTFEFPDYVCKKYNDFFVALLASQHPATPADKNISFDSKGGPVSVNNAFVEACDPKLGATTPKKYPCKLGVAELAGTGFQKSQWGSDHASTSWLGTTASIVPGETITLRFAIWDMNDAFLDSTVLLDEFTWSVDPASGDTPPVTAPMNPK